MSNIIIPRRNKSDKDCCDWCPLKDGTKTGDTKYCDLSQQCKQVGMKTDWHFFKDELTGETDYDYFCTGMCVTEENKKDDDEVS